MDIREQLAFLFYVWAHPGKPEELLKAWWAETLRDSAVDLVSYFWKADRIIELIERNGYRQEFNYECR